MYVVNLVKSTLYYGDPHNKDQKFYKPFFLFLPEMVPIDNDEDVCGRICDLRSGSGLKLRSKLRRGSSEIHHLVVL